MSSILEFDDSDALYEVLRLDDVPVAIHQIGKSQCIAETDLSHEDFLNQFLRGLRQFGSITHGQWPRL